MSLAPYDFSFFKATATGNDFLIADLMDKDAAARWSRAFGTRSRGEWARIWCDRYNGLGADGLVFLEPALSADFKWDFFNSDGSPAAMCGNAARAVSLYVAETLKRAELHFETNVGVIRSSVRSSQEIEVELPEISEEAWGGDFDFVRPGVPHVVIHCAALENIADMTRQAVAIKAMDRFKIEGTNVTFVQKWTDDHIKAMTFERGVEGFTKSCGTGAVAAAYAILRGKMGHRMQVDVPGGRLFVVWNTRRPLLTGPAKITGEMRWMRE